MFKIKLASENAIIIYFNETISPALTQRIASYTEAIKKELKELIVDIVPSYNSLLITYRLELIQHNEFCEKVNTILSNTNLDAKTSSTETIAIPVYYNIEVGLDLERLLHEKKLDLETFVILHSEQAYFVYAIGFSPAFAFLGEVDERIQAPRLATPRIKIPAGSVGIANQQTAVYPIESSGGWNIVGRTPIDLSLNNPDNINRFKVGQQVKFKPIDKGTYLSMGGKS